MRFHKRVFIDLMVKMLGFGVCIGVIFPFFTLLFGVDKSIALSPLFFLACVLAGIIVGLISLLISKANIKYRLLNLISNMDKVNKMVSDFQNDTTSTELQTDEYMIYEDSSDCFGQMADSFNTLVETLMETLNSQKSHRNYLENLTQNLDLKELSDFALKNLMAYAKASAGALLVEKEGELITTSSYGISDDAGLETNNIILNVLKSGARSTLNFPEGILLDGILTDYRPSEIIVEPITYRNLNTGVLLMATATKLDVAFLEQLDIFMRSFSLILNNSLQHEQMQKLAALDPLTGVYNRRFGLNRLKEECSRSVRFNSPLGVMMLDIDKFKLVNDTYGHIAGDRVIKRIVVEIQKILRSGDILIRYGGEEFMVILPGANSDNTYKVAERVRFAISQSKAIYGESEIQVNVSIGVDSFPDSNVSEPLELIKNADTALYTAKNTGRNRTIVFNKI